MVGRVSALWGLLALAPPAPSPSPTPTPRPRVEQQAETVLDEKQRTEPPRFESSIEVVGESPQGILDRRLRGLDLECSPAGAGPPTESETRAVRPHPSPYMDYVPVAKWLAGKMKGKQADRYFLYRVRRLDGLGYTLREGRISDSEFYNTTGASFELLEGFPDAKQGTIALRRMERGFDTTTSPDALPVQPWATSPCRPPK